MCKAWSLQRVGVGACVRGARGEPASGECEAQLARRFRWSLDPLFAWSVRAASRRKTKSGIISFLVLVPLPLLDGSGGRGPGRARRCSVWHWHTVCMAYSHA
jgi:hypothetical protein